MKIGDMFPKRNGFRNPHQYGIDPMREWMRHACPSASDGFVPIDVDLAVRTYGSVFGIDAEGTLMVVEKKEFTGQVTGGEKAVYRWLNSAIASGSHADRWRGCHILEIAYTEHWPECSGCGQSIRTDAETAMRMFLTATLRWDYLPITHDELACCLRTGERPAKTRDAGVEEEF